MKKKTRKRVKKNKNKYSISFIAIETIIFLGTQLLGLYIGFVLFNIEEVRQIIEEQDMSIVSFIISFSIGTALLLLLIKYVKTGSIFKLIFYFMLFFGVLTFFDVFIPLQINLLLTSILIIIRYYKKIVVLHNLTLVLSIIGISSYLGLGLSVAQTLVILLILIVYDYIAVHKTGHMVEMFQKMAVKGAMFSVVIPNKFKLLFTDMDEAKPGEQFLFLGTGDLAFPIVFSVSALKFSILHSVLIIVGAFAGIIVINLYQRYAKNVQAMAALPPIAGGAAIGFVVAMLITLLR